jgi:hypothetical protein
VPAYDRLVVIVEPPYFARPFRGLVRFSFDRVKFILSRLNGLHADVDVGDFHVHGGYEINASDLRDNGENLRVIPGIIRERRASVMER